ncbi:hypothetical protein EJ06DRAFT_505668 [Trichodelitschia bisporula]|uniref:Uncharacterized protein n=1 Tax=Trichodelitschia bisporula TaxID=703511 RepID=A0A6G1I3F7_9PEZI|nr:hypothetical protein EJ06DRAFT_505668 [Trichodelitschia bisporula]
MVAGIRAWSCRANVLHRSSVRHTSSITPGARSKGPAVKNRLKEVGKFKAPPQTYEYPESLLIFNNGAFKSSLVATIKVATVCFFAGSCLFLAPRYVIAEEEANWKAGPAVLLGAVPMLVVSTLTAPYVATVRMQLPSHARLSRQALMRFCNNLPHKTPLEFATVRLSGMQKTTATTVGELHPLKPRIGRIANIVRVIPGIQDKTSLWAKMSVWVREPRNKFFVDGMEGIRRSRAPGVWELVMKEIKKRPVVS